jgi:PiT family inorganic phosphate transporter
MADIAAMSGKTSGRPDLDAKVAPVTAIIFILLLATGLLFTVHGVYTDVQATGVPVTTYLPFLLLGVALLIALGFEFVNGFHDTANAVATVIYTHSLPAQFAVVWSGLFNFLGVLWSTGAVAFAIVSLLPVELILQVGSEAGFAMVFALLFAAIVWNLGTAAVKNGPSLSGHRRRVLDGCEHASTAHSDMTMLFPGGGKAHCLENPAEQPEETA